MAERIVQFAELAARLNEVANDVAALATIAPEISSITGGVHASVAFAEEEGICIVPLDSQSAPMRHGETLDRKGSWIAEAMSEPGTMVVVRAQTRSSPERAAVLGHAPAAVIAPLVASEEVFGTLNVAFAEGEDAAATSEILVEQLASLLAGALKRLRLAAELDDKVLEAQALSNRLNLVSVLGRDMAACKTEEAVFDLLFARLPHLCAVDYLGVVFMNPDIEARYRARPEFTGVIERGVASGTPLQLAYEGGLAVRLADISALPETNQIRIDLNQRGVRSLLVAPILVDGRTESVLSLGARALAGFGEHASSVLWHLIGFVGVSLGRARALERAHRQHRIAQEANETRARLLANISHEIRTPLNAVMGMCSTLALTSLDGAQRESVDVIRQSGRATLSMLNDLLDFASIESMPTELESSNFDLCALITSAVALCNPAAREKSLTLSLRIADEVPTWVRTDPSRLRQILVNLVANAVRFTASGSIQITVNLALQSGQVPKLVVTIVDTGIGIPSAEHEEVFVPFMRSDASPMREFEGSGLGLATCRRLSRMLGGNVWLERSDDTGSEFCFSCALELVENPPEPVEVPNNPVLRELRILVAEDNPVNQLVIRRMLQSLGYEAEIVGNGQEALLAVEAADYDVVLLDVRMPVLDGIDTARVVTQRPGACPWLVALTASATDTERKRCLDAGMNRFLAKPVELLSLAAALQDVPLRSAA